MFDLVRFTDNRINAFSIRCITLPELPEVETVCRGLQRLIIGDTMRDAKVLRSDSIEFPSPEQFCRSIRRHRFEKVRRRAKYILIDLDRGAGLAIHLRMTGRVLIVDHKAPPERFLRVRIGLESGRDLRFEDMRVFGRLWYIPPGKTFEEVIPTLAELGIEPLDELDGAHLKKVLLGKKQAIKSALLDQRVIAGLGNIYADESLFRANIHPMRAAGDLKSKELELLSEAIREVLMKAIDLRGTTLRDYRDTEGVNGNYQHSSLVYGRYGQPCRICGREIERAKIGGRSSHFCTGCQPLKNKRSSGATK
jgi:formamidopyrimidine-DNA glycosylase